MAELTVDREKMYIDWINSLLNQLIHVNQNDTLRKEQFEQLMHMVMLKTLTRTIEENDKSSILGDVPKA